MLLFYSHNYKRYTDVRDSSTRLLLQAPTTQAVCDSVKSSHVHSGMIGVEYYCPAVQPNMHKLNDI